MMVPTDNLYDTIFPDDNDFDVAMETIGLMYDHLNFDEISKYFDLDQYNRSFPTDDEKILSIIHLNIRSLNKNGDEMVVMLESIKKKPDIIVISESFLDSNSTSHMKINGYNDFHVARGGETNRGGVSIYTRTNLDTEHVQEFSYVDSEIEICTIKLKTTQYNYTISGIYRPSYKHHKVKEFNEKLSNMLRHDQFKKSKTILIGDFNINLLEHNTHRETSEFMNKMQSLNYLPLISRPTRFPEGEQNARPSLLDHIYTNFIHQSISGIVHYNITDHLPIFINMSIAESTSKTVQIKFRHFTEANKQLFKRSLNNVEWERLLIEDDVDQNFTLFHDKFKELYNNHFPIKTKNVSIKRIQNPWITSGLLNSIRQKNLMFKNLKLGNVNRLNYNAYRNRLNALIRLTKRNYYMNIFSNFKNNTKKLWQTINNMTKSNTTQTKLNTIINDDKIITDPIDISNTFNDFFTNIAKKLDDNLTKPVTDPMSYMQGHFPHSMTAPVANLQDFFDVVKELENKKCGVNDFSPSTIKDNANILASPLVSLFNQSIQQSKFPNILKTARIVPIYKKGTKTDMNNFRPISILNIFSKIFEKIMKKYLIEFMETHNILSSNQYGFQKKKSTQDALTKFSEMIYNQLDGSNHVLSIFVDFSKAFDTVPHDILLKKTRVLWNTWNSKRLV